MSVLVDTSVWSLAYRRKGSDLNSSESRIVDRLLQLIRAKESRSIGPIRQELLSGVKHAAQFEKLRVAFSAFPDDALETADYEEAARLFNFCRSKGLDVTHVDILICAVALRRGYAVFTCDVNLQRCCRLLQVILV